MKPGWLGWGLQGLAWLWAAPGTLIGLPLAMLARATGGGAVRRGRTMRWRSATWCWGATR